MAYGKNDPYLLSYEHYEWGFNLSHESLVHSIL